MNYTITFCESDLDFYQEHKTIISIGLTELPREYLKKTAPYFILIKAFFLIM